MSHEIFQFAGDGHDVQVDEDQECICISDFEGPTHEDGSTVVIPIPNRIAIRMALAVLEHFKNHHPDLYSEAL